MLKLSNIRIGTKLAIMSGLGVVLVTVMLAIASHRQLRGQDAQLKRLLPSNAWHYALRV